MGHLFINSMSSYFIFKVLNPIYMYSSTSEETIDWDFILEVKLSIKHDNNLEVKNTTQSSLALRLSLL